MKKIGILLFISVLFAGCDLHSKTLSYHFTSKDCSTGKQTFHSQKSYCDALMNDKLNKDCEKKNREETYKKNCQ